MRYTLLLKMAFTLLLLLSLASPVGAYAAVDTMNGYSAEQFGDFVKNWHLVTVRFRNDTKELRFTYANDAAWSTLSLGKVEYPDGAIFAKVGIITKSDPAFPSSEAPSGARRIQFMVRDKQKHASTDGWGYALFDNEGKIFPGDQKQMTLACAACHRLVPDRSYVFSQMMTRPSVLLSTMKSGEAAWSSRLRFSSRTAASLPESIQNLLPKDVKMLRVLDGELSKKIFSGTLDEIRPALAQELLRSGQPSLLISKDGHEFSLVMKSPATACNSANGETGMKGIHSLPGKTKNYEIEFCQSAP